MRSWDKHFAILASVVYSVFLADFVTRSSEDIHNKTISCGTLDKVELSNSTGYRGSSVGTMIYLTMDRGHVKYRINRKAIEATESLTPFIDSRVCVASLSSPMLGFLVYPIEIVHESKNVIFKEPIERTYLNLGPYIFWFFLLPISFILTKALNDWARRKRTKA